MQDVEFSGQVAIVTGAAAGMGRATALLLAQRGASVVVNDPAVSVDGLGQRISSAELVVKQIEAEGGRAIAETTAVGTHEAARAIVSAAMDAYGRIDMLINNAGIVRPGPFGAIDDSAVDLVHAVNLTGPFALMRAVWPTMRDQGYGRIVNVSSSGALGSGISGPYATSKAGLIGLTKDAGIAGRPLGIKVNAIMPAAYTALMDNHPDRAYREWFRRFAPERVAAVTAFLVSREVPCTGEIFAAGGGRISRIAFIEGNSFVDPELTPESVRDNFADICDLSSGTVLATQADHQRNVGKDFPGMPDVY